MEKSIVLTQAQKELLLNHASKLSPNESCAILFGIIKRDKSIVKEVFLAKNIEESPVKFRISPDENYKIYDMEKEKNLKIVGIFHSHPSLVAYPSSTDKQAMELNPYVWVISSGESNELKAFLLEQEIIEIPVVIS